MVSETEHLTERGGAVAAKQERTSKQAVVVIHGIGEQKPMDTIKNFVRAVWETNEGIALKPDWTKQKWNGELPKLEQIWSRPDARTGSLELRRITTRRSVLSPTFPGGARTDFYELYWADLSGGSTWQQVQGWIKGLLFRNPFTRVPPKVRLAWVLLWALSLSVVVLALATTLPASASIFSIKVSDIIIPLRWLAGFETWQLAAFTAILGFLTHKFVVPYVGRVVRYTRADPDNIAARKNVRERGLELLRELHAAEYDRIILVGHSLGSIVAYDLLTYFWAERPASRTIDEAKKDEFDALRELTHATDALMETSAAAPGSKVPPGVQERFLKAQSEFCRLLRRRSKDSKPDTRWIITDFVTLGSPLTHAEFLMAASAADLEERKTNREFPTSPPIREIQDPDVAIIAHKAALTHHQDQRRLFCYPVVGTPGRWQLDHGAPFAVVRWTNIYDPARLVFFGDIISGAVAAAFGPGVCEIDLRKANKRQSWCFTHTLYWSGSASESAAPARVIALRDALDLAGRLRTV